MPIHVGLVGYGLGGSVFHAPLIAATPGLELTAVVSSRTEQVGRDCPTAAVLPTFEALLAQPTLDVVVIASPNTTHHDYARRALLAGKHVVVDKPFTNTTAEADDLIDLARRQGLLLTVFQNRRWDGGFLTARHLLQSGALGTPYTYEAHYDRFRPQVRDRWKENDLPGSGILYDLGPHLVDQAVCLLGMPHAVTADLQAQRPGSPSVDYVHLILHYERLRAILHAGVIVAGTGPRLALHGDRGSYLNWGNDPQEEQLKAGLRPGGPGWGAEPAEQYGTLTTGPGERTTVPTLPGRYEAFYGGVAAAVATGGPAPVDPVEARNVIAIIEAAVRSQAEGRTITL